MSLSELQRLQILVRTVQDAISCELRRRIPDIIRVKRLRALKTAIRARLQSEMAPVLA
ncbi:hypothetical protein [Sandarakinorhabdus sp.]|uniref:hypothetical protein n=1 Tax=Sandarakinorhabdus sp. TaxID=1916663 RepID=UPI00286E0AC6|nr:hypothetical protein [Sandarakinorhabdus sp.]